MQSTLGTEILSPPEDGISCLRFVPGSSSYSLLLATSWDGSVRIYDTAVNKKSRQFNQVAPVLAGCFSDASVVYAAGVERVIRRYDLSTGAEVELGRHDAPIRCLEFDADHGMLISGSWDCSVRCWDPRMNSLVATMRQPHKVFSMSQGGSRVVVATAHRQVTIFDKRMMSLQGSEPEQRRESSLKFQTRCVSAYPDGSGYALSSVEGRVAMEYFDQNPETQARKYAFKCHRKIEDGKELIYPVNAIAFHPTFGTFASGGCDGFVNVWDGNNKKRLHQYPQYQTSIAAMSFNSTGDQLAIAASYTFEEGEKEHPSDKIFVRKINEGEVKPKPKLQPR